MNKSSLIKTLKKFDAYWCAETYTESFHAKLASGEHSGEYFNLSKLNNMAVLRDLLIDSLAYSILKDRSIDCVCGQAYGSISWALALSSLLDVDFIFTEKNLHGDLVLKRFDISKYDSILVCEDTLTTGETSKKTILSLGEFKIDSIFTFINRGESQKLFCEKRKIPIYSTANIQAVNYGVKECPFCRAGSTAVLPKEHWDVLNEHKYI